MVQCYFVAPFMPIVIMLNVTMLSVVMLNVVAPALDTHRIISQMGGMTDVLTKIEVEMA
jgi:hypothetical protein